MPFVIKVKIAGTEDYLAAEQNTNPHAEYDATTFDLTPLVELAAKYKTREAAEAEIARRALGGVARVEDVQS